MRILTLPGGPPAAGAWLLHAAAARRRHQRGHSRHHRRRRRDRAVRRARRSRGRRPRLGDPVEPGPLDDPRCAHRRPARAAPREPRHLQRRGARVTIVGSGKQAIERFAASLFGLVGLAFAVKAVTG
eukprot:scaffold138529_cov130-Phaeocystis_antarctica.AAC.1